MFKIIFELVSLVSFSIFQEQGPHPVPLTDIRWKIFAIIEIKSSVDIVATMPPHFPDLLGYQIPIIESIRFLSVRGPPGTPG